MAPEMSNRRMCTHIKQAGRKLCFVTFASNAGTSSLGVLTTYSHLFSGVFESCEDLLMLTQG